MIAESYSFLRSADGVFPEYLSEIVWTFGSASAGETHEGRIEVGEGLHEIFTERSVLPVVPELGRFRKQSDEIKVEHSGGIGNDTEAAVGAAQSLQSSFIFFPFIGDASECEYIGIEVSVLILKINLEITLVGFSPEVQPEIIADVLYSRNRRSLGIVGIVIFFAFSVFCYSESICGYSEPVSGVFHLETYAVLLVTLFVIIFIIWVEVIMTLEIFHERFVGNSPCATPCITLANDGPAEEYAVAYGELVFRSIRHIVCLKRIVLDKLCTDTAVERIVYIFKEYSPECWADFNSEFLRLEGKRSFFFRLESLKLKHLVGETVSEEPHSFGTEMELIACTFATES